MKSHQHSFYQAIVLLLAITAWTSRVEAQVNSQSNQIKLAENPYISYTNPKQWLVDSSVYLTRPKVGYPDYVRAADLVPYLEGFNFRYPLIYETASSWGDPEGPVIGEFYYDNELQDIDYTLKFTDRSHQPYTIWPIRFEFCDPYYIRFDHTLTVTSVGTEFHEREALNLGWPTTWKQDAEIHLTPIVEPLGKPQQVFPAQAQSAPDEQVIVDLLSQWTNGQDPKALRPVHLAKFLAGMLVENFQCSGRSMTNPPRTTILRQLDKNFTGGRARANMNGGFYHGFDIQPADEAAKTMRGSSNDMAALLTSIYRAAGIPARTIIGIDNEETGEDRIKSWTEFAIYDTELDLTVWVPVDIDQLRRRGIRAMQYNTQTWKYFGTNHDLNNIAPIAMYFQPPETFRTAKQPGLFGIDSEQPIPYFGEQIVAFSINRKPVRGGE